MKRIIYIAALLIASLAYLTKAKAQETRISYIYGKVSNFDTLISKFRNKVIYVDFWATWCAPCRRELRDKKAMQKFEAYAAQHSIVVLYISGDKDDNSWRAFIDQNKLTGYHILLNSSLYNDVITRFSFYENRAGKLKKGFYIPRHLIVNRSGIVADSMAADRNNAALYTRLGEALKSR